MGCSSRSKRCFTKMWGFSNRFHPPPPFFFSFWKCLKNLPPDTGLHGQVWGRTGGKLCKHFFTWLNADSCLFPLLFCLLEVLSSNMAPPCWRNRDKVCVCVWLLICLFETKQAHIRHRIPLQSLAKAGGSGMDPFELSVLLLFAPEPCS